MCLGLSLYLAEPPTPEQARAAWNAYRSVCPSERMRFARNTRMILWQELASDQRKDLAPYLAPLDERLDVGALVWDGYPRSYWTFWIQGVLVPERGPHASYLLVRFSDEVFPETIHALAVRLTDALPFLSGHAGFTVEFKPGLKGRAFDQIFAWSRRYLGLEVEDLNRTLPVVLDAVKGASWLTLVGNGLWSKVTDTIGGQPELPESVDLHRGKHGIVLRAGPQPVLADRNRQEFPAAYAAVERLIQPVKVQSHPEFSGRFREEGLTMAWLRRLTEPENW